MLVLVLILVLILILIIILILILIIIIIILFVLTGFQTGSGQTFVFTEGPQIPYGQFSDFETAKYIIITTITSSYYY